MQLLHGLAPRFEMICIVLGDTNPLPPFGVVRSCLELAEYNISLRTATDGATALSITHGGSGGSGGPGGPGGSGGSGGSGDRGGSRPPPGDRAGPDGAHGRGGSSLGGYNDERGHGRGRGRGRGRADSSGRRAPPASPASFTGYFAPYGMALPSPCPGWSAPNAAGVLGPRPGVHSQAYPVMLSGPSPPYSAPAGQMQFHLPAPSCDHAALFNHAANQPDFPSNEWYMDTRASSHVTGNRGSSHSDGTHDVQ
ncbi:collagen alpha-1(I) chain-like [Triticum aestivum]|uniref:collagen alpha-1(I) chain-like n=1 Tax=Triticum aestivum TaxID=4565 RepID=UPI001D02D114|nr:collagen alpha-1(I) chain-like [Triticum aestivum]